MNRLDGSGNRTSEEFHYSFDHGGRLKVSAFAQTPNGSSTYDQLIASSRAVVAHAYNDRGQALDVAHWWQVFDTGGELDDEDRIGRTVYTYDNTKGLRLTATYRNASDTAFSTEEYDYDSLEDYLTGVEYDNSTTHTWSYDAAGNRANSGYAYDNLNRILTSPNGGGTFGYEHHILGNRLWRNQNYPGGVRMTWDLLNRMISCCRESSGANYTYRIDGMRVKKVEGLTLGWNPSNAPDGSGHYDEITAIDRNTTRYMYDGSNCYEEDYTVTGQDRVVTRYAAGGRGTDAQYRKVGSGTETAAYPLYDGHGNVVAMLSRSGSSYAISDNRLYDVWGSVRSQSSLSNGNGPRQRYCGNLGHFQDDETGTFTSGVTNGDGLIYMRARYYEPGTGRFVSQDPSLVGLNWYIYCRNQPASRIDANGEVDLTEESAAAGEMVGLQGGGGSVFQAAANFFRSKLANIVGKTNVRIFVEVVEPELIELGSGQFQYRAGQLFIQLARGSGQNIRVLAHELGEALFRAAELHGRIAAGWTHAESEAWALARFAEFGIFP